MLYPYEISTGIDLKTNKLFIRNKTNQDWNNIRISLTDGYAEEFFFQIIDIKANQEVILEIYNNLHFSHYEVGIDLRIVQLNKLLYKRKLNEFRKKTFLIYTNKKFEDLAEQLLIGLTRYSEHQILYYTVDFESDLHLKFPNLTCKKFEYDVHPELIEDNQFMQMLKPQVFSSAIEEGFEDIVFLDVDIQVNEKVDKLFDYFASVDFQTPILTRQYWHYIFVGPVYVPGPQLMEEMDYKEEKQFQGHGITNVFLFRKELKPLLDKWKFWCQRPAIVKKIRKEEFLHDELIFNLLTWKEKVKFKLVNFVFNVRNLEDVKAYNFHEQDPVMGWLNFNDMGLGHTSQSFAPFHKEETIGYHCVKDIETAKQINDFIFEEFLKNNK